MSKQQNKKVIHVYGGRRAGKMAALKSSGLLMITPAMLQDRPLLGVDLNSKKHVSNVKVK